MAEYGRGAKAGIFAGIIYAIISAILGAIVIFAFKDAIMENAEQALIDAGITGTDVGSLIVFIIPAMIFGIIIGGIIFGLIFGLIYAAVYNSLPGSTSIKRGIVLSIIAWLIFSVGFGYINIASLGIAYYLINSIIIGFITWAIWGYFLGHFWDRFGKPAKT